MSDADKKEENTPKVELPEEFLAEVEALQRKVNKLEERVKHDIQLTRKE